MGEQSRRPVRLSSPKILLATGLSGVLALSVFVGTSGATAADTTFNPFDVNGGFTLLVQGDAVLNNGELEGSIAVDGTVSSGNPNGYPIVHHVAGTPDYTVPVVDGEPVRILAGSYAGAGSFEITNRSAVPGSPEALATARFADVAGLSGSSRGSNWLRVSNTDGGNLDLPTIPFQPAHASDLDVLRTSLPSVADYFPQRTQLLERNARCLTGLYDPSADLVHRVPIRTDGSMAFPGPYSTDRPNVLNYSDIAGKIIKPDAANGYLPTAQAPLIIKVDANTSELNRLGFEGWSAQGDGQKLARTIFIDASAVTGALTVDGLEMGAIYAPNASVNFSSGTTHNGQWATAGFASNGGGELHHHTFLGELPCAAAAGGQPTPGPTTAPTASPTAEPTVAPTAEPTPSPTAEPTSSPTPEPTVAPTTEPTTEPTSSPTPEPTVAPTMGPTTEPTSSPTAEPTVAPTSEPTVAPTAEPTAEPTTEPTAAPTTEPTSEPTSSPTAEPTVSPTAEPTVEPTTEPTSSPTAEPTVAPTSEPTDPTEEPGDDGSVSPAPEPSTGASDGPGAAAPAGPGTDPGSSVDGQNAEGSPSAGGFSRLADTGAGRIAMLAAAGLSLLILGVTALALRRRGNA